MLVNINNKHLSKTGNLDSKLKLKMHPPIMLITNVDISDIVYAYNTYQIHISVFELSDSS